MRTTHNSNIFGMSKKDAFQKGIENRTRFLDIVQKIPALSSNDKYPHRYIFGYPGIGKTFEITNHLENTGVRYVMISGSISMFAFGISLAVLNYTNQSQERIIVVCDDVDTLMGDESSIGLLKSALHGQKIFTYEKSLSSQWGNLSELQKEAINHHQEVGKMGFKVPTHNMSFVIISNIQLPTDDDVNLARIKGKSKASLLAHKNAIRSRCMVQDFSLSNGELWGWIGDVILNTDCLSQYNLREDEKYVILDFLWDNWEQLTERSIRLVEKMAIIKNEYPNSFLSIWKIDFLK